MKLNYIIISAIILVCTCISISATSINIIYPNDNITTDIYYSTGDNISYLQSNSINTTDDITYLLIKNQYESIDIVEEPEKIVDYGVLIFWVIMFLIVIISLAYTIGRIFR